MNPNAPQPATDSPQGPCAAAPQRPGSVNGIWLVAATLSLFIIVPALTIIAWKLTAGGGVEPAPLVWADRHDWFMQNARPRPLEYDKFVQGETGRQYRKTNLTLTPADEQMLQRLTTLARADTFFKTEAIRDDLVSYAADYPDQWYPPYLLASWLKVNGDDAGYQRWMAQAFDRADGAIVQRIVDLEGEPVVGYRLPAVAVGYDRVVDGKRNATLTLVYPAPISDERGYVFLPAFWTIYRLTDPLAPPGVEPPTHPKVLTLLPQPMDGPVPNWFSVPPPGIAQLPDGVVEVQSDP